MNAVGRMHLPKASEHFQTASTEEYFEQAVFESTYIHANNNFVKKCAIICN